MDALLIDNVTNVRLYVYIFKRVSKKRSKRGRLNGSFSLFTVYVWH